jgi:hypothetical protein
MGNVNARFIIIGLLGIILGCAGATVLPIRAPQAQPTSGEWVCYEALHDNTDTDKARNKGFALKQTQGLNQVAKHVPAGTIVPFLQGGLACVKY